MAWLPKCEELERAVGGRNWLDMMIVYFDEYALARQINALCDTLTNVIDGRWSFVGVLDMLAYKFVPGKMAEFMKEMQDKDIPNLMKL
ncbi:hypothetical protein Tco_0503674 [Tanacetum coccineum]